jgi:DNA-binding GntR family transcriptional regulator
MEIADLIGLGGRRSPGRICRSREAEGDVRQRAGQTVALGAETASRQAALSLPAATGIIPPDARSLHISARDAIVAMLDSSRLDEFYAELTRELRFYLMVLSTEDREYENPAALLAEHEAILTAIRSGDAGCAAAAARSHIETNARRLKEILAERGRRSTGRR